MPTPAATEGRPFPARVVTMQGADTGVGVCVCVGVGVEDVDGAMVLWQVAGGSWGEGVGELLKGSWA